MKPLYFKIAEENRMTFIKVVKSGSLATVGFLIRSFDNSWKTDAQMFNLNKKEDGQKYTALVESCLESNRKEFDEASNEVLKQADTLSKKGKNNS